MIILTYIWRNGGYALVPEIKMRFLKLTSLWIFELRTTPVAVRPTTVVHQFGFALWLWRVFRHTPRLYAVHWDSGGSLRCGGVPCSRSCLSSSGSLVHLFEPLSLFPSPFPEQPLVFFPSLPPFPFLLLLPGLPFPFLFLTQTVPSSSTSSTPSPGWPPVQTSH